MLLCKYVCLLILQLANRACQYTAQNFATNKKVILGKKLCIKIACSTKTLSCVLYKQTINSKVKRPSDELGGESKLVSIN